VSCLAGSAETLKNFFESMSLQTIGFNKVNQLAHARFLRSAGGVAAHMARHAAILRPKFRLVDQIFSENLGGLEIASWTKPLGGYFINLVTPKNTAGRIVRLCGEANVKITPAGAAFPYGHDPDDRNIRIAPTFPREDELATAAQLLTVCVRMAALEQILGAKDACTS
jgi:DNA-binding transcriptional MocR family regulator